MEYSTSPRPAVIIMSHAFSNVKWNLRRCRVQRMLCSHSKTCFGYAEQNRQRCVSPLLQDELLHYRDTQEAGQLAFARQVLYLSLQRSHNSPCLQTPSEDSQGLPCWHGWRCSAGQQEAGLDGCLTLVLASVAPQPVMQHANQDQAPEYIL